MKLKVRCDYCGIEFERNKSNIHNTNYCSRKCLGKANGMRLKKHKKMVCDYCGQEFEYIKRNVDRNKHFFCSKECGYKFKEKKVTLKCDWCGDELIRKQSDVKRNKHNFCSFDCYRDYRNFAEAGAYNQTIDGKTVYRRLYEVAHGVILGSDDEIHHIDGEHTNNAIENLLLVSKSEHAKIHSAEKERDVYGRFIKSRKST